MANSIYQLLLRAKHLLWFEEAVRWGSLTDAAKANSFKQPNLSNLISEFEKTVQKKLLDRYAKGVGLTDAGKPYYQIAAELRNLLIASENMPSLKNSDCGSIKLWISDGLASIYLARCFEEFYQKYPKVNLDINCSIDMPELHEFDMALLFHKPKIKSLKLIAERDMHFSLFASQDYLKKYGCPENIRDMCENHKICANLVYAATWQKWQNIIKKARYSTTINNGSGVLLNLVKAGGGIALMPVIVGRQEKGLVEIKNIVSDFKTKFFLVVKQSYEQNQKIKDLSKIINAETLKQAV